MHLTRGDRKAFRFRFRMKKRGENRCAFVRISFLLNSLLFAVRLCRCVSIGQRKFLRRIVFSPFPLFYVRHFKSIVLHTEKGSYYCFGYFALFLYASSIAILMWIELSNYWVRFHWNERARVSSENIIFFEIAINKRWFIIPCVCMYAGSSEEIPCNLL